MKKTRYLSVLILVVLLINCQKEENSTDILKGSVSVNIGLFVTVNEVENSLKSTAAADDFRVAICKGEQEVIVFERASEMPDMIDLEIGEYKITANSKNNLPAAFENAYYYGESDLFIVTPGSQQTVNVNCQLANTAVNIVYSEQVKANFTEYSTLVSTSAGSLQFLKNETRTGYFQPLPFEISASLTWQKRDGTSEIKTLTGSIPDPQPRKRYEIHVDAAPGAGASAILINVDETPAPVEIINITDTDTGAQGPFKLGDLLITEIMYDPVLLSDAEGEWFEIYNTTGLPVDLNGIVIRKNDTEQHIVSRSVIVNEHAYQVMAKTEMAVQGSKYIYGTSISLNNTGAVISLYNYGTNGTDGSLICAINYNGTNGFPSASGASISLAPTMLNYTNAISGTSWCLSASNYNTGDKGTPGSSNDPCL